ncbi:MAG TPA: restriction endonuclease subunit S [Nitrospira sp.]|nr:restriction endonuclease subunit S [Nitrospira sp.]HNG04450.1 restriction endonuclease subunit S [Nitrospira sp.]HNO34539.1 restriction endonuclease subunit S [Nitrospira sp.]
MSHYKPYPAYRDSGVEWIGEVPEHWKKMPFKRVASICNGRDYKEVEDANGAYPVIGSGGEFARASDFMFDGESVLLGRKGTIDKPLYINGPFWAVDTMFYTKIADNAFPKFVYYSALTIPFGLYSTNTALPSMAGEDLSSHVIVAPEVEEQKAIAVGVDRETARIDALITKKTRFIELLKEKRQALITHAVTKGLDPNVKMKDSGVEWIGEVPEHWDVKPLKIIASCNDDSLPESMPLDMPIRYVDISAVSHDGGISRAESMMFGDAPSRARRRAKLGDVVVSTVRTYLKAVASVDEAHTDCVYSTGFAVLRARSEQLAPEFLKWLVLNDLLIQAVESHSEGLSYPAINSSELVNLKTVVPGLPEQKRIAATLDRETSRIDLLTEKTQRSIDLLKERRAAFITAAVTGQIDLRESA